MVAIVPCCALCKRWRSPGTRRYDGVVTDLAIPDAWAHLEAGPYTGGYGQPVDLSFGTYRTRTLLNGKPARFQYPQHVSDQHVGWDGDELVARTEDGATRPLGEVDVSTEDLAELVAFGEQARAAALAERQRPIYSLDGPDVVVTVDGQVAARITPDQWRGDDREDGDRSVRLARRLTTAGFKADPEVRVALIAAFDERRAAGNPPKGDALDEAIANAPATLAYLMSLRDAT
jgi:hypothetical protein